MTMPHEEAIAFSKFVIAKARPGLTRRTNAPRLQTRRGVTRRTEGVQRVKPGSTMIHRAGAGGSAESRRRGQVQHWRGIPRQKRNRPGLTRMKRVPGNSGHRPRPTPSGGGNVRNRMAKPPKRTPKFGAKRPKRPIKKGKLDKAGWDESKHKRDDAGKFARKQGGGGKSGKGGKGAHDAGAIHVKVDSSPVNTKYGKVVMFEDGSWGYKNPSKDMIGPDGLVKLNADQKKTLDNVILTKIHEWRSRMLPSEQRDWDRFAADWAKKTPQEQAKLANRAERSRNR